MIYILVGNDLKKRNIYKKTLLDNREVILPTQSQISTDLLLGYAGGSTLFGNSLSFVIENILHEDSFILSAKDLIILQESNSFFIFLEDTLKAVDEKKYKKYATIEHFNDRKLNPVLKINTFSIADAFARRDKIDTWILYNNAIIKGVEPELISGMLFWKIKMMILNGNKLFHINELKNQSSNIVSLYHRAHRGECDFSIGLEQFILTSLTK